MTQGSTVQCIKVYDGKPLTIVGRKMLEAAKKIEASQK